MFRDSDEYYFAPDKLEAYKDANLLKGGLVYADAITTVSPTYAEEIKTPFYGEGLDGLLCARSNDLRGILNGIDYDTNNPETDPNIPYHFNANSVYTEKVKDKLALQAEVGLPQDPDVALIGIVTRLTWQKGLDLILNRMEEILQRKSRRSRIGKRQRRQPRFGSS
mgnify:CR=1 FL=1